MTRFGRIRRRPDHWVSSHDRARVRAAERLDGPLGLSEATWLDAHLAECTECAAIAAAYEADRQSLQAMRTAPPEPPRDLWARTAAAIEHESAARHGTGRRAARDRRVPLGALSGLAVIAVVVGVSTMSSGTFFFGGAPRPETALEDVASEAPSAATDTQTSGGAAAQVEPTPIAVAPGRVRWVDLDRQDGSLALNAADIDEVCPADLESSCATLAGSARERLSLASAPETIIAAPDDAQAIVVSRDAAGKQQLLVVDLPAADAVTAAASPDPLTTAPPAESPPPSTVPTAPPSAAVSPSEAPTASAEPTASAPPEVTPSVEPTPPPEVVPSATPEATLKASLAIASDIEIVGESAAFSADGVWFAFTARPAGDATGSDVYLWKVGEDVAQPLTSDGTSSFASWDGDRVVISRPGPVDTAGGASAEGSPTTSLTIDPATGAETDATTSWRPAVDPSGSHAVAWSGTIAAGEDGDFRPDEGSLELIDWPPAAGDATAQTVVDGAIGDFDVRWDETGDWFAVWTADPADTGLGRLSLFRIDEDGQLVRPKDAPAAVPALPGFSIGDGRLAWATPPGQGGEGSRVQIVAWAGEGVGSVESAPGEDLVVIR